MFLFEDILGVIRKTAVNDWFSNQVFSIYKIDVGIISNSILQNTSEVGLERYLYRNE